MYIHIRKSIFFKYTMCVNNIYLYKLKLIFMCIYLYNKKIYIIHILFKHNFPRDCKSVKKLFP